MLQLDRLALKRALYRLDPVEFVKRELKETPSSDQEILLRDFADLSKLYFILSAGRGAGKTKIASWLVAWSVACLQDIYGSYPCTILGGSGKQSKLLNRYFKSYIFRTPMLQDCLPQGGRPGIWRTEFQNDSWVEAMTASETSVRGPHCQLLILDETASANDDLVESALGQVSGMSHGRIIMQSTPHRAVGLFRDFWDLHGEKGFIKHGPWPLTNCPWISKDYIEHARKFYTPEKFKADILGQFPRGVGSVFDSVWVDASSSFGVFGPNPSYDAFLGVDYGFVQSHTVSTLVQEINGILYVCGPPNIYEHLGYPEQVARIDGLVKKHRVVAISGDSSHEGENQRLERLGYNVNRVKFIRSKEPIVEMLTMLLASGKVRISSDMTALISQLKRYSRILKAGRETFRKVNDDSVDSLICAVYPFYEMGGFAPRAPDKFLTF